MAHPETVASSGATEWPQVGSQKAHHDVPMQSTSTPRPDLAVLIQSLLLVVPDQLWTVLATVLLMLFAKWLFMTPSKSSTTTASTPKPAEGSQQPEPSHPDATGSDPPRTGRWTAKEPAAKEPSTKGEGDQAQIPKSPTTKPQSFGPKETSKSVETDPPAKKEVTVVTKADDKPQQPADGAQKAPDQSTSTTTTPAVTPAKTAGAPKAATPATPQVTAQVMFKNLQETRADIQGLATRLEAIERILGIMSEKIGPLHANVTTMQKSQDSHYKEFSTSFAKVCGHMRGNFDETQQLARENYQNMEQRLGAVENKLVGGIQKTLEKITNCDYQTNQCFDKKIDNLGSEVLAALHFVQTELAEVKQSASTTSEEVRSIREMCERPVPAAAPQYRAPHFAAQLPGPAPSYEAAVSARSLSLQNAIPAEPSITISPDGRSLHIPLR